MFTWGDASGNWSDPTAWQSGSAPSGADNTDTLIFGGATTSAYTANNDVSGTFVLNQVILTNNTSTTQTLSGNQVQFDGTSPQLQQNSTGQFTINNDLTLTADTTLGGSGSGTVTLNGAIGGNNALNVNGGGPFVVTGNNTYSGGTTITNGSLAVNNASGSGTGSGDVSVNNAGHLSGSGTVSGNLNVNKGGLADGALTIGGNATITGGTLGGSGTVSGNVTINSAGLVNGNNTIGTTTVNSGGTLAGSGTVTGDVFVEGGTVNSSRTIQGNAQVDSGVLGGSGVVKGSVVVNNTGTLSGNMGVGTLTINSGGVLSPGPGNTTGRLFAQETTFNGGGIYRWLVNDVNGSAGQALGWDLLNVTGNLNVNSSSADPFIVQLEALNGHNPGDPIGFNFHTVDLFPIIEVTSGSIVNFSSSDFAIETSGFPGTAPQYWSIAQVGNNIDLEYHGVPEPGLMNLLAVGMVLFLAEWLRRRYVCRVEATA